MSEMYCMRFYPAEGHISVTVVVHALVGAFRFPTAREGSIRLFQSRISAAERLKKCLPSTERPLGGATE